MHKFVKKEAETAAHAKKRVIMTDVDALKKQINNLQTCRDQIQTNSEVVKKEYNEANQKHWTITKLWNRSWVIKPAEKDMETLSHLMEDLESKLERTKLSNLNTNAIDQLLTDVVTQCFPTLENQQLFHQLQSGQPYSDLKKIVIINNLRKLKNAYLMQACIEDARSFFIFTTMLQNPNTKKSQLLSMLCVILIGQMGFQDLIMKIKTSKISMLFYFI